MHANTAHTGLATVNAATRSKLRDIEWTEKHLANKQATQPLAITAIKLNVYNGFRLLIVSIHSSRHTAKNTNRLAGSSLKLCYFATLAFIAVWGATWIKVTALS